MVPPPKPGFIMLSFRGNGRDEFLDKIQKELKRKSCVIKIKKEEKEEVKAAKAGMS